MNEISITPGKLSDQLLFSTNESSYAQNVARSVEMSEAGMSLAKLAKDVQSGQEIVVTVNGVPVMRLVPIEGGDGLLDSKAKAFLSAGSWAHLQPDFDWDLWDSLDEEVRKLFKNLT